MNLKFSMMTGAQYAIAIGSIALLLACTPSATWLTTSPTPKTTDSSMTDDQTPKQSANQTGVVPEERVSWVKNPLITQIKFHKAITRTNSLEIQYYLSYTNPSSGDVKTTGMPTPDGPLIRMYSDNKEIRPAPEKNTGVEPYLAAPRDDEIKGYSYITKAKEKWTSDVPDEFVVMNTQFLSGTHIYEIVYWQTHLDWIDVRAVLEGTDSQGKGKMLYPITDNAPSNRLYFKVYAPTAEEAKEGRHVEFLGEVDARTQRIAFPYARPGDYAPATGYWSATGESIKRLGGYHEVFAKEGDSLPNLPGDRGVDPFSFQWKYVGAQSQAGDL